MEIILTLHAKEQMVERGVSRQQVSDAIKKGSKVVQTDGFLASYSYIKVAYKMRGDKYIVKTVMLR
ncbi:DUF4258 domain-containing protein [Candidatus Woesearchaeota archaeon]|nr:DUF4258 domain-containing protein [Candidatus Woesearchaeota archaeon]